MSDYERIAKAIEFINRSVNEQPTLEQIAAHLNMSRYHFQRVFRHWAGVTPKRYLQILTVERAKLLLSESTPLLEVSESLGLSSGSRLYDHFVKLEAVTPGEFKSKGIGLTIQYSLQSSPFGELFIAQTDRGICKLAFTEHGDITSQLNELKKCWPNAALQECSMHDSVIQSVFKKDVKLDRPLSLHVVGTNFQVSVWRALLDIPVGCIASYGQIAESIGKPGSSRAVGLAVGANPVAFLIPCHRVIRQDGGIGGYRWGTTRKQAIQAWESAISFDKTP
jgi:AraC family transcriptional regulator of adaptative response/methylated-DNA-[protein]-cysteine methyltransferase